MSREHAAAIKAALCDPRKVCEALGLLSGPRSFMRQAAGLLVRCPVHEDRTPSCSVQNRQGALLWNCHGCGAGGDVLDLVAAVHGLSVERDFKAVLRECAELGGLWDVVDELEGRAVQRTPRPTPRHAAVQPEPTIELQRFHEIAAWLLEQCPLTPHSRAGRYLAARSLYEQARAAGIAALPMPGAEQDALVAALVERFGGADLELAGVLRDGRLSWRFHVVLIPWRARDGRVSTLQRRLVAPFDHVPPYVFARGLRPVDPFGADALRTAGPNAPFALVEGALDVLALREIIHGHSSHVVLGVPGVATWRDDWTELVRGRRVVVAFDADKAGDAGAEVRLRELCGIAAEVRRVRPTHGKDWGEQLSAGRRAA